MSRVIVHLDADAFFASVEQAADPRLRGKPVAVGGEKRGIIASASYEARRFGIHTPMPTVRARKLCPKLIVLPGDFEKYEHFSRWMFSYAYDFTPDVEITSIDEGYFDLSGVRKPPVDIARTIRGAIGQALKISVSEGIGSNKLVSQIASKLHKPAAFTQVPAGREVSFLHPLLNRWLPGVGPRTASRLNAAGLAQVWQVAAMPLELLDLLLGRPAVSLKQFANGIDERPVVPVGEAAKSFSQQETFAADLTDEGYVEAVLRRMADHLMAKVRAERRGIRTVTVKVRYNDMAEDQCSESLPEPTEVETDLYGRLPVLLRQAWKRRVSLRLVSLKLSNVYEGWFRSELALEPASQRQAARQRLAQVVDELRRQRGHGVVLRGHDFRLRDGPVEGVGEPSVPVPKPMAKPVSYRAVPARPRRMTPSVLPVPLNVRSHYSFLNSTLSIEAIIGLARRDGLPAVALTDQGNLHGAIEFAQAARAAGVRPILGVELQVEGRALLLYVQSARGYHNLCRLLSGRKRAMTARAAGENGELGGESVAAWQRRSWELHELEGHTGDLIAVGSGRAVAELFPGRFYERMMAPPEEGPGGSGAGGNRVACWPVYYATPADRLEFDILQSIRTGTLLRQAHPGKLAGGQGHFRSPAELRRWYERHPDLLAGTVEIADRCLFEIQEGRPQFPAFVPPDGSTPHAFLERLVFQGLRERYRERAGKFEAQIREELAIIHEVGYEEYFLVVWNILQECRRRGIEWITRGSAADSLVCYCLRISDVCPVRFDLYFRRFLNKERMSLHKLPDIDVDFPHDRKDDVVDLVFERYGLEHTAVVGGFSTYRARAAVADVGKVLGIAERQIRRFTAAIHGRARGLRESLQENIECRELPLEEEPFKTTLRLAELLDGFPRHPKMHPCGVVLSCQPMHELTPTFVSNKGYPSTHFDMDAVEAIGLVKIDILAQGGLAVMRDTKEALAGRGVEVDLGSLEPWEDPRVWRMIAGGGARAVHHIESPAMLNLCRMTQVREIDGLIAIVSVIRPGAANEQKKLKFTRRYQGLEPVDYPHPSLESCLRSTFGLVVYEEHILQICEAFAGLNPGRADVLRRALSKEKPAVVAAIQVEFFASARARGHPEEKIAEVWGLVSGFAGYAFCKAHSTAYGVEAYQAAWLKCHHPAEFMAAVLTHGKGFYAPLVYVLECHRLGLSLLPPSVNHPGPAFVACGRSIRVPLTRLKGLGDRTRERLLAERARGPFAGLRDFHERVRPLPEELESMIRAGALDEFGRTRTAQFWEAQVLRQSGGDPAEPSQGWLLPAPETKALPAMSLREPTRRERLEWETELFDFTVSGHPLELYDTVAWETYCPVDRLHEHLGREVITCGLVIEERVHHQVTGEPMKFLTLADRTGMVETELFAPTYRRHGLATVRYPVLEITATVEPFENGQGFTLRVHSANKPRFVS